MTFGQDFFSPHMCLKNQVSVNIPINRRSANEMKPESQPLKTSLSWVGPLSPARCLVSHMAIGKRAMVVVCRSRLPSPS